MNIILVSSRFAKARSITLNGTHLLLVALLAFGLLLAAAFAAQYAIVRFHPDALSAEMRTWLSGVQAESKQKQQAYLREEIGRAHV